LNPSENQFKLTQKDSSNESFTFLVMINMSYKTSKKFQKILSRPGLGKQYAACKFVKFLNVFRNCIMIRYIKRIPFFFFPCRKTKGVLNTGQIRSIYKDEHEDELVGLSMERYNYTLKEYAFNTRAPITGEQKYMLIHDMIKGIKALHDAGFAHRDLSEVNMMVNSTTEILSDGSPKPELVVIDFGKAEFINRDDVLA
jgi:hypothetical protein